MVSTITSAQVSEDSELFKILKAKDSLIFDVGFNTCNVEVYDEILFDDLEFYHDQGGITVGRDTFIDNFKNGICARNDFKSRRELIQGSLQVYPMYQNGKLYAAIQKGEHRFFEKFGDQPETKGSIALFTHLWLLDGDHWKLKRVLSYDHKNQ